MADKIELTDFGSKLLYGSFSGEPGAIVSFVLGTSSEAHDRATNGCKAPVYRGQVSAITYVDLSSMVIHLQVPGDARALDGTDLATGTEFRELVLYTEDKNPFAVASLELPIRYERGSRVTPIQIPVTLERPVSRVIDTLTASEHALLPGTRLQDLPAPHDSTANAIIVNDLFYAGLERPTIAFKYGVAAHRWTFSDHLLAGQYTPAGTVAAGEDWPLAFELYPDERLIAFVAVGKGYGSTRMVRFWFKDGKPTLTVEGSPLELGPTSLVLLYRHYTNQLPPTANVPSHYVLSSGKQVSTSRQPNALRFRILNGWVEAGDSATRLEGYNIETSRDFADQHLVWLDGKLQQLGTYAFVNDRLILTANAPQRLRVTTLVFTSENTSDSWAPFFTFNRQDALPELDAYDNQLLGDDALLVFDAASGEPLATRIYMTGSAATNDARWVFEQTPVSPYVAWSQSPAKQVSAWSSPRVLRGIADADGLGFSATPVSLALFIDGKLTLEYSLENNRFMFRAEDLGKAYTLLVIESVYAELEVPTKNYKWVDPEGRFVQYGLGCFKREYGKLAVGAEVEIPDADVLLVFCNGLKLAKFEYQHLPHRKTLRIKQAGLYTVVGFRRDTTSGAAGLKIRKNNFVAAPAQSFDFPAGSEWLLFVGPVQQSASDVKVTVSGTTLTLEVSGKLLGNRSCLVVLSKVELTGNLCSSLLRREFVDSEYYAVGENVSRDDLLVFADSLYVHDAYWETAFFDGSTVIDITPDLGRYRTELYAFAQQERSATVGYLEFERFTNLALA